MDQQRQPFFDLRDGSLHLRDLQSDVDEEWTSTLKFLEADDEFFGEDDHHKVVCNLVPIKVPSTQADKFLSSGNSDSEIFNEDQIEDILGALNTSNQSLEEQTSPSKASQTIDLACVDYRNHLSGPLPPTTPSYAVPSSTTTMDPMSKLSPSLSNKPLPRTVSSDGSTDGRKKRKPRATSFEFPFRLHEMLNDVHGKDEHKDSIQWLPDGSGFMILSVKKFSTETLPQYFGTLKHKSFIRQLNIYEFVRRHGAYSHPCFIRGHVNLCWNMRRQKVKGTGKKPLHEVDFVSCVVSIHHDT